MDQCPNCGTENRTGARFCAGCGANLLTVDSPVPSPEPDPGTTGPSTPMPGEPDMHKLLEMLPELDIKTVDLQIPLPPIDVGAEVERLTRLNLEEQIRIINRLEQQLSTQQDSD